MIRNRFEAILSHLHAVNNANLDPLDKFFKLSPLISILNESSKQDFPNKMRFSIDESMIPYYGRHGCKQYIRGKSIRFGCKFWCEATRHGYIC